MLSLRNLPAAVGATGLLGLSLLSATAASAAEQRDPAVLRGVTVIEEVVDEDSPYRTGGDVQIVTRAEIDARHYTNVTEAIRRIPGVQVSGPGYKAYEYGLTFGEEISINGDSSVIVMVDGRRVDNDANSYGQSNASKSRVPLDVLTNIANIERIEVIKGTGSAAYGADATGGVINIITRKGTDDHQTRADLALGSWGRQNFSLTQGGSFLSDDSLRYFVSLSHQKSGDTYYKDWVTGRTLEYDNTRFVDNGASARISKAFGTDQEINLQWSWTMGKSHYPITSLDMATIDLLYSGRLPQGTVGGVPANQRPGYRNWFYWDAALGSYTRPRSSDLDLKYIFDKGNGTESYLRAFRNDRRYQTRDFAGVFNTQWQNVTPALIEQAKRSAGRWSFELVDGYETQLAHTFGRHALMTGWTWRDSEYRSRSISNGATSYVERDSLTGFLQDKIALTSGWTLTPGARYSKYSDIKRTATSGTVTERDGNSKITYTAHTSYESDLLGSWYASWAQIFRAKTNNDYNNEAPAIEVLHDERGNSWTVGVRKTIRSTAFDVNYALTDMSNAIARYSIFDPNVVNTGSPTGFGNFVTRQVNATQKKKALNLGVDHRFGESWAAKASYAYVSDEFKAKNWANNPDDVNVNALINRFRPTNTYRADVSYGSGRWSAGTTAEYFTGLRDEYFTGQHFLVIGLVANYEFPRLLWGNSRAYVKVENLTNEAWENRAHPVYGAGTYPQPARNFTVGFQHNF